MKKIFFVFVAILFLASCQAVNNVYSKIGKKQVSVANTQWSLVDNNIKDSKMPTLIIEKNRVTGNGGCNNYFGELAMNPQNGDFNVDNIGSTKMACNHMMTEQNYFNLLEQVTKYVITDSTLELYKGNLLLLKYKKL